MILAAWRRWIDSGQWWWLLALGAIVIADGAIGSWLIAREIELVRAEWQ